MTTTTVAIIVVAALAILLILLFLSRSIWLVPPSRARNVERLGQFHKTMEPGLNFVLPMIDRVKDLIDLREQVVSFTGQRVITEDNVVVAIDTVLFFQVTDPRAAQYEIVDYIDAIEKLSATMLRSVIGSMDLEQTLTSRDKINTLLRGVLDDASGKWGIRVTRVEIRSIDPPQTIKDAMEKQLKAEREKRAAILNAEGLQQSQILTAEGDKKGAILRAEGEKQAAILRAEGQAQAISTVFKSIHDGDPDPKLLAYQYLQTLPQLAQGDGNTVWMIPSELTGALRMLSQAFGGDAAEPEKVPVPRQSPRTVEGLRSVEGLRPAELPAQPPAPAPGAIAAASSTTVPGPVHAPDLRSDGAAGPWSDAARSDGGQSDTDGQANG
jgi:regulator of protease activity HflC (stomatin/prohibitin superfamily)